MAKTILKQSEELVKELSLDVPEGSKGSVGITVKGKKAKVGLARKYKRGTVGVEATLEKDQKPEITAGAKFEWD